MAAYIANVMTTVSKLENIGLTVDDKWVIAFMLVGLGKEYNPVIMGLGANTKITSVEVKMKLLDSNETNEGVQALFSGKSKQGKKKNFQKKKQEAKQRSKR